MYLPRTTLRRKTLAWIIGVCGSLALSLYASLSAIDQRTYHLVAGWFWESGRSIYELGMTLWPMHYRYPPLFLFLYTPLIVLPFRAAVVVWTLGKCGVLAWLATRLSQRAGGLRPVAWGVAACIAVPYVVMEFRYANVQFFVFALVAAALLFPRRTFTAAGLLGLAIAIKVWPLFFVPLLAAQKRWKLAAGSVLVALVLTASPALYLGWEGNMKLLGQWYEQEFNTASRIDTLWFPSQSLSGVMARYLTDIDYEALPDSNYPEVNIVAWPPQDVALLWMGLAAVGYAALLLEAGRFRNQDLVLYSVAFCALLLLQPYSQKQSALVLLVWPAIVGAARAGSMPKGAKAAFYCAAGLSALQPLLADAAVQRWLQVIGMDALIVVLACFALSMTLVRESNAQQQHGSQDPSKTQASCEPLPDAKIAPKPSRFRTRGSCGSNASESNLASISLQFPGSSGGPMADKNERRDFISDAVKMGGAAGMAALAMAVPAKGAEHKVEKTQAGVRIGNLVFTSGLTGTRKGGESDFGGSVEEQTRTILQKHKDNLEAIGSSLENVLKVTVFQSDIKVEKPAMNKAYAEFFKTHQPSRSAVGVEFPDSRTKVEIEMIAYVPE